MSAVPVLLGALLAAAVPAEAQFADRSTDAGLQWAQITYGAAFADMDQDGDLDLYSGHHYYAPTLYWNDGTGIFDRFLHPQPWAGDTDRHGGLLLSLDADELPEIFVTHGSDAGLGMEKNELYRNDGAGSFGWIFAVGGVDDFEGRKRAASAADCDGDGLVDVWVGKAPHVTSWNSLYHNEGDLTFTDIAASVGLDESIGTVGGIFGDVDDDGDPDLLVGGEEFTRPTTLFRNDGDHFADITSLAFAAPLPIVSCADFGDFDDDGDLDLALVDGEIGVFDTYAEGDTATFFFNTRYGDAGLDGLTLPSTADTAFALFHIRGLIDTAHVFLGPAQEHASSFAALTLTDAYAGEPTFTPGVDRGIWVWRETPGGPWEIRCSTPSTGFDTFDGWFADGAPIAAIVPHDLEDAGFTPGGPHVWRNDGGTFQDVTALLGLPGMLNPCDISWVDYDNDGDLDLHVVDMGTSAVRNAPDALFRNDGETFADVTSEEGVAGSSAGMGDGGIWADVDGDLDMDLYLQEGGGPYALSQYGPATFLRNEGIRGNAIFLDLVGTFSGTAAVGTSVTAWFGDQVVRRRSAANSWRGFQDPLRVHVGLDTLTVCDSLSVTWPSGLVERLGPLDAGVWRIVEGTTITGVPEAVAAGAPRRPAWRVASLFPQPARGRLTLLLSLERSLTLHVAAFDVAGRRVATLHRGRLPQGDSRIEWDGHGPSGALLPAGVYFLRASDGTRQETVRAVRVR